MAIDIDAILKLPADERLEIIERICESLDENIPTSEFEITVARERLQEYQENVSNSLNWEDARNSLFKKYGLDNQD